MSGNEFNSFRCRGKGREGEKERLFHPARQDGPGGGVSASNIQARLQRFRLDSEVIRAGTAFFGFPACFFRRTVYSLIQRLLHGGVPVSTGRAELQLHVEDDRWPR